MRVRIGFLLPFLIFCFLLSVLPPPRLLGILRLPAVSISMQYSANSANEMCFPLCSQKCLRFLVVEIWLSESVFKMMKLASVCISAICYKATIYCSVLNWRFFNNIFGGTCARMRGQRLAFHSFEERHPTLRNHSLDVRPRHNAVAIDVELLPHRHEDVVLKHRRAALHRFGTLMVYVDGT